MIRNLSRDMVLFVLGNSRGGSRGLPFDVSVAKRRRDQDSRRPTPSLSALPSWAPKLVSSREVLRAVRVSSRWTIRSHGRGLLAHGRWTLPLSYCWVLVRALVCAGETACPEGRKRRSRESSSCSREESRTGAPRKCWRCWTACAGPTGRRESGSRTCTSSRWRRVLSTAGGGIL